MKTQIWCAVATYVLIASIRKELQLGKRSFQDVCHDQRRVATLVLHVSRCSTAVSSSSGILLTDGKVKTAPRTMQWARGAVYSGLMQSARFAHNETNLRSRVFSAFRPRSGAWRRSYPPLPACRRGLSTTLIGIVDLLERLAIPLAAHPARIISQVGIGLLDLVTGLETGGAREGYRSGSARWCCRGARQGRRRPCL